jgi:hypothetical protein
VNRIRAHASHTNAHIRFLGSSAARHGRALAPQVRWVSADVGGARHSQAIAASHVLVSAAGDGRVLSWTLPSDSDPARSVGGAGSAAAVGVSVGSLGGAGGGGAGRLTPVARLAVRGSDIRRSQKARSVQSHVAY